MIDLLEIKHYLKIIGEAISNVLDIHTTIVNVNGDPISEQESDKEWSTHNTVIKNVILNGLVCINDAPGNEPECRECPNHGNCLESAYMHCPIFFVGKVVGAIGLICYTKEQRQRLLTKHDYFLVVINTMCDLVCLKLKEQQFLKKLQQQQTLLHNTINAISEGYIIVSTNNTIAHINQSAISALHLPADVVEQSVYQVIQYDRLVSMIEPKTYHTYDELTVGNQSIGFTISPLGSPDMEGGCAVNLRTVETLSSKLYGKVLSTSNGITFDHILGTSAPMQDVKKTAELIAKSEANVLILGESGTGKKVFARAIHTHSLRRESPFIDVNCAAIPAELLESELFGYEKGAFTGASKNGKLGKFKLADGGTIFLDEIGDMPIHLQSKILRVLQQRTVDKLGGSSSKKVDFRVIVATNRNLEEMVRNHEFREDLFYRLQRKHSTVPSPPSATGKPMTWHCG
ncbi:MAG: sigma 54-interacting transcriptional regulator [Eubacteriales bacterium]